MHNINIVQLQCNALKNYKNFFLIVLEKFYNFFEDSILQTENCIFDEDVSSTYNKTVLHTYLILKNWKINVR